MYLSNAKAYNLLLGNRSQFVELGPTVATKVTIVITSQVRARLIARLAWEEGREN